MFCTKRFNLFNFRDKMIETSLAEEQRMAAKLTNETEVERYKVESKKVQKILLNQN